MTLSVAFGIVLLALSVLGMLWVCARELGWWSAIGMFAGIAALGWAMLAGSMLVSGRWVL